MGAAGDMLSASLYELLDDKENFIKKINSIGLEGVEIKPEPMSKCGIVGTHMNVTVDGVSEDSIMHEHEDHEHSHEHSHGHEHEHIASEACEHDHIHSHEHITTDGHDHTHSHETENDHIHESETNGHLHDEGHHEHSHEHHHSGMHDIERIVNGLDISDKVKTDVISVYKLIAEAESAAHGRPVDEIHFHEVGTKDAIADVTTVCMLMDELKAEKVIASPVHVGSGHVHCAHGILPVPAPATAYILKGVPIYSGHIRGELCTPTGAALLKYFVDEFKEMPIMTVDKIGYGMGRKDFEQANCVRALIGETKKNAEQIVELTCNIDDMTPERIAFATERFFEEGAVEVFTTSIGMKKSRPGILLSVMCKEDRKEDMIKHIFKYTTTLGVRENISCRYTLERNIIVKETEFGNVRIKRSEGFGVLREKYEYEDLARIAKEKGISIDEVIVLLKCE